jgi:hypothetical protein
VHRRRDRISAACVVVVVVALGSTACEAQSSSRDVVPSTVATSPSGADADAMQAAEATVRAFFAVKRQARDSPSIQIDAQAAYLTARDVHPGAAYEAGWRGHPTGVTDTDSRVELSDSRWLGDGIQIDFAFTGTSMSYPVEGTELQLDAGAPGDFYWNGTATLENRDGEWLINDLTTDSSGGSVG